MRGSSQSRSLRELAEDDPLRSRAARLASQAAYWLNDDDGALAHSLHAFEWATTLERRGPRFGVLTLRRTIAGQTGSTRASGISLRARRKRRGFGAPRRSRTSCLRIARGSFKGAWSVLEPLLPLASTTQDPAVSTNFLAHCAYVRVMAGEYEKGLELVTDGAGDEREARAYLRSASVLVLESARRRSA